jgi:hypothetical protein
MHKYMSQIAEISAIVPVVYFGQNETSTQVDWKIQNLSSDFETIVPWRFLVNVTLITLVSVLTDRTIYW